MTNITEGTIFLNEKKRAYNPIRAVRSGGIAYKDHTSAPDTLRA